MFIQQIKTNPLKPFGFIIRHYFSWIKNDRLYLKLLFFFETKGKILHLGTPLTFSEKIQWLKLYNHNPDYSKMVDKLAVKAYVEEIIGKEHVIPTLGVWERGESIDWDKLPNKFVLKTTNGGGNTGVVICKDKNSFDEGLAIEKLNASLKHDIYRFLREWPYKNVNPLIIAEQYIDPEPGMNDLSDYKWYCFNGEPKYCQLIQGRTTRETIDFYNSDWNHQDFVGLNPLAGQSSKLAQRPKQLDVQLSIARKLSKDIPFVRIDLYEVGGQVFFGEMTFYPMSGMGSFRPQKYNEQLGALITLPQPINQ